MWNVLLVALWRWYLPLSIYIINKEIVLYLILMWYRLMRRNGRRYQHVLAWYACSVGNQIIERTNSSDNSLMFVCVRVCFCVIFVRGFCRFSLKKGV